MQAQQTFEFNKTSGAMDGAEKGSGVGPASDALRPNMAAPEFNAGHKSVSQNSSNTGTNKMESVCGADQPKEPQKEEEDFKTQTAEQKRLARLKVAEGTAKFITREDNKVILGTDEKALIVAAMEHQLKSGGVKAADTICDDISIGLPNGIKLESKPNPAFEKRVKQVFDEAKKPVPEYIRWVQMKDKGGTVIGEFGVTVDKIPK